jgi:Ca-activated chloride channel family protein
MSKNTAVLKELTAAGRVVGTFFMNEVRQVFINNSGSNVEFIYTFPIPADASVSDFSAMVGGESFVGVVREKEEALKKYQKAIAKGDSAYMLESHRDNIFETSLGNVAKGEEVTVNISYIQDIGMSGSEMRLLIPTLVSPRYIPGYPSGKKTGMGSQSPTNHVPDADFISPVIGETGYKAEFHVSFELDNDISEISSPSHEITARYEGGQGNVAVNQADLNSDFVLNVSMRGGQKEKFITTPETKNGCFSYLSFIPKLKAVPYANKEFVFMIDVSGSMSGENIESAKKALKICLRNMEADDIFNIIAFESDFEVFAEHGVEFNEVSFKKANAWIDKLHDRGGTEIYQALRYAVESTKVFGDKEKIIMILTDGQVGNEDEIVTYLHKNFDGRVFCVGIDVNVNDSFLNKVSAVGNGFTEFYYPESNEDLAGKIVRQFARSNAAFLKDVRIETNGSADIAGKLPKYLYSDECYTLVLKTGQKPGALRVIGTDGGDEVTLEYPVTDDNGSAALFQKLWAKKKLAEIEIETLDLNPRHENIWKQKIVDISTVYGVICRYTSFIAVNERSVKESTLPKVVAVPVDAPKRKSKPTSGVSPDQYELVGFLGLAADSNSTLLSSSRPFGENVFSQSEIDSLLCCVSLQDVDSMEYDVEKDIPVVDSLYETITKRESPISERDFSLDIRGKMIELAGNIADIDISTAFEKLDVILAAVERFYSKGDQSFDVCFNKLIQILVDKCNFGDKSMSLADIASVQSFDGSFAQCSQLKMKFSIAAAKRFSDEGEAFLYKRQIDKLISFIHRKDATAIEDGGLSTLLGSVRYSG